MSGRRIALLIGATATVLVACAGCHAAADNTPASTVRTGQSTSQLNDQLNQLQSTVDGVQAQLSADATP